MEEKKEEKEEEDNDEDEVKGLTSYFGLKREVEFSKWYSVTPQHSLSSISL